PCEFVSPGSEKIPLTPYVGIPAARRNRPSVAPVDITGITGISPYIVFVSAVTAVNSSGTMASADLGNFSRTGSLNVILTEVSATIRWSVARVSSALDVGAILQFTFAEAVCGS